MGKKSPSAAPQKIFNLFPKLNLCFLIQIKESQKWHMFIGEPHQVYTLQVLGSTTVQPFVAPEGTVWSLINLGLKTKTWKWKKEVTLPDL